MHQNLVEYSWGPGLIISIDSTVVFDSMSICLYVRKSRVGRGVEQNFVLECEIKSYARLLARAHTHKLRYSLSLSLYIYIYTHTFCANIIFYCGTFRLLYCSVSVKQQMLS